MVDVHDAMTPRPKLPDVNLEELVSRTNLSEVWRGRRISDGAPVAVKLAVAESAERMLRVEADAVEAIRSANIRNVVPVQHVARPFPHLILPWKGGRTLRDELDGVTGGDGRSKLMSLLLRVVEIVTDVHRSGFFHGDLKPENILIDGRGTPWLTDFGMARAIRDARLDSHVSLSMDRSGKVWGGTLHYMPPEGLQGEEPEPSWDVYAVGVLLHECLLGSRPDRAMTPDQLRTVLPPNVVEVLLKALAYSPKDRYPTTRLLLMDLLTIEFELTAKGPARWFLRARRLVVNGLAAFFVALRYSAVFGLVACYLLILGLTVFIHPAFLFGYLPFLLFHAVIRWEGPETVAEAQLRIEGYVLK